MSKSYPVIPVLVLFALFIGACTQKPSEAISQKTKQPESAIKIPSHYLTFNSDLYTISHPPDWEVENFGHFVHFKTPFEGPNDELQDNVAVYATSLEPQNQTLIELFEKSVEALVETTPGFALIEHKEIGLSSAPAQRIIYSDEDGLRKHQYMQVFMVKDGKAFVFTYTAAAENYEKYFADANAIINSFKVK